MSIDLEIAFRTISRLILFVVTLFILLLFILLLFIYTHFVRLKISKTKLTNSKIVTQATQPEDRRLRVTIGISGWLTQKEDIITPWRALGRQSEVFALRWELEALNKLGSSLESVVKSAAWTVFFTFLFPEISYRHGSIPGTQ